LSISLQWRDWKMKDLILDEWMLNLLVYRIMKLFGKRGATIMDSSIRRTTQMWSWLNSLRIYGPICIKRMWLPIMKSIWYLQRAFWQKGKGGMYVGHNLQLRGNVQILKHTRGAIYPLNLVLNGLNSTWIGRQN